MALRRHTDILAMTTRVSMVIMARAGTEDMAMQVAIPVVDAGSGE
jgi:hypothetical protein